MWQRKEGYAMNIKKLLLVSTFWFIGLTLTNCAPVRTASAVSKAKDAMEGLVLRMKSTIGDKKLTEVQARYYAPAIYKYYLAKNYLDKAKEFEGFSEFGDAELYATKAYALAKQAEQDLVEAERRLVRRQQILSGIIPGKGTTKTPKRPNIK